MIHEMFDAADATAEMPLQTRAHHSPARSRSIAHRHVCVFNAQHVMLNQIHDLLVERRLQPISDVTGKFLFQMDRFLSNRCVKRERSLNRFWRCIRSADNLHYWDDVWRIERMSDEITFGLFGF